MSRGQESVRGFHRARIRRHQSGETLEQRCLARAVRANQSQHFAMPYREGYVAEHATLLEILGYAFDS